MNPLYNFIITPIYLTLLYLFVRFFIEKKLTNKYTKIYFRLGLILKTIGSIFFCLIYMYYYGGGDNTRYFLQGGILSDLFIESPIIGLKTFFHENGKFDGEIMPYINRLYMAREISTWRMVQISTFFEVITFKSYFITSFFFGLWSFIGTWRLGQVFLNTYKYNYKLICISLIIIPSCLFWSSGIVKESITTGAIGFLVYEFHEFFIKKKKSLKSIIIILLIIKLIIDIKGATVYILLPCLVIWLFLHNLNSFSKFVKIIFSLSMMVAIPIILLFVGENFEKYVESSEEFKSAKETISGFQSDHGSQRSKNRGHGGGQASTYHLKTAGDLSLLGILFSFPEAVSYTLFRPFPWETKKIVQLLGSFESFSILLITLYLILKVGPYNLLKRTISDPNLVFLIGYALLFGFIAGYISYNFGVLQRFKTPMMPFYTLFLAIHFGFIKQKKLIKKRKKIIRV